MYEHHRRHGSDKRHKHILEWPEKEGHENDKGVQALIEVLQSDEITKFINDTYQGAVIPFQ